MADAKKPRRRRSRPRRRARRHAARRSRASQASAVPALHPDHIAALVEGRHPRPHDALGQHPHGRGLRHPRRAPAGEVGHGGPRRRHPRRARARRPRALARHRAGAGPGVRARGDLRRGARLDRPDDPYRFVPSVGETDLYLWGEGRHEQIWQVLGAHFRPHEDVRGTSFSVWAPHAQAVRVVGDFNAWDGTQHVMRRLDDNGVWEIFIPGLDPGTHLQVRAADAGRRVGQARRPDGPVHAGAARHRIRRRSVVVRVGRRRLDGPPRRSRPAQLGDERVRAAHRILAPRPRLPRARRPAHRVRARAGVHARRVPAASPSTRTGRRGATRSPGTTPRPAASGIPTTSST